jgi:hypothetical protein
LRNLILVTAFLLTPATGWPEVLDRIAVTVGKTVITEGEVLTNLRVAAFLDRKEPDLSRASKKQAAERLVDQVLLRREVPLTGVLQDLSVVIADLKKRYPSEAAYQAALEHYQITEQDVTDQLLNGLESVEASNRRFRPEVQVPEEQIHARYDIFAKQLRASTTANIPSFDASRNRVQELLTDEGVSEALEKWLEMMRDQSSIVYRDGVFK